jgi:hypothetical protein
MNLTQLRNWGVVQPMFLNYSNLVKSFVSIRGHREDFSGGLANYQTVHILWAENRFSMLFSWLKLTLPTRKE